MEKESIKLLEDIKKLLILDLTRQGVQGKDISAILGVDPAIISRLLTLGNKKK